LRSGLAAFAAVLAVPLGFASAEEPFRHARVRVVEPGVTLQSATETTSEEAVPNMPFLPGDRVWTDGRGRIELHFADGSLVRVDSRSKLDYDGYDRANGGQVVLRLWSGSVYVHQRATTRSPEFVIETPSAAANLRSRGVYRLDAIEGETRLSVFDGDAYFDAADRVLVRAGERAFARRGDRISSPDRFDRSEEPDAFARWDAELGDDASGPRRSEHLPEELSPFAEDFERNGAWSFEAGVGNVWRPYVPTSWRPYSFGRWGWTAYGWTWVPNEPWGWAPFHYGRWDYANGWFWIPGNTWGPGWVSWSAGHDYVGWCPLGYRDRTVVVHDRGRAVPRGTAVAAASSPWTYVRRADLGTSDVARRRVEPAAVPLAQMRTVDMARARILRDGTVGAGAVPRNVRTKPGVGDTVPELRTDNMTAIPLPVARTRYESEGERGEKESDGANATWSPRGRPQPADSGVRHDREATSNIWSWGGRRLVAEQASPAATPSPETAVRRRPEPSRTEEGDREALRPWFGKFTRPRDEKRSAPEPRDEQATARERSRPQDTPRDEPRQLRSEPKRERQSPPPPPPPPPNDGGRGAVRREKNRDQ
jgi:uncharacterized protein DUF6600/FecR-like protein